MDDREGCERGLGISVLMARRDDDDDDDVCARVRVCVCDKINNHDRTNENISLLLPTF